MADGPWNDFKGKDESGPWSDFATSPKAQGKPSSITVSGKRPFQVPVAPVREPISPPPSPLTIGSELPEMSRPMLPSEGLQMLGEHLHQKARQAEEANLSQVARGKGQSVTQRAKALGLDIAGSTLGTAGGMVSPKSLAIAGAAALAPVPTGVALVGHGLWNAVPAIPSALQGNPEAAERALGGMAEATGGAALSTGGWKASQPTRNAAAQRIVELPTKISPSATSVNERYNINPQQAIIDEGLSGTKRSIVPKADAKLAEIGQKIDQTLTLPQYSRMNPQAHMDLTADINQARTKWIADAQRAGDKGGLINRINKVADAMLTQYGNSADMVPMEATLLKRGIADEVRWNKPEHSLPYDSEVNAFRMDVVSRLKDRINAQVPEVAPLNQRWANLRAAKTALDYQRIVSKGEPVSVGTASKIASLGVNTTIGRTILGRILGTPLEAPTTPPPSTQFLNNPPPRMLGPGPMITPPPLDTSGPVNLGPPTISPRVPRGPERQLPQQAIGGIEPPARTISTVQKPPNIQLPRSAHEVHVELDRLGIKRPMLTPKQYDTVKTVITGPRYRSWSIEEQKSYLEGLLAGPQPPPK
jgi:hypothetical protein